MILVNLLHAVSHIDNYTACGTTRRFGQMAEYINVQTIAGSIELIPNNLEKTSPLPTGEVRALKGLPLNEGDNESSTWFNLVRSPTPFSEIRFRNSGALGKATTLSTGGPGEGKYMTIIIIVRFGHYEHSVDDTCGIEVLIGKGCGSCGGVMEVKEE